MAYKGIWPSVSHDGRPLDAGRLVKANRRMVASWAVVEYRGDWKWHREVFGLTRFYNYRAPGVYHMCEANNRPGHSQFLVATASHRILFCGFVNSQPTKHIKSTGAKSFVFLPLAQIIVRFSRFENFASFYRFSTGEFYSRCLGSWVSPFTMIAGFHPALIRMCSMHTIHLGICQFANAAAILDLCDLQFFGGGLLSEKLNILTHRFNNWCRLQGIELLAIHVANLS